MPLQKSYSERIEPPRDRSAWQRSHSHPAKIQAPKAAVPISQVTKDKLNEFKYRSPNDGPPENESMDDGLPTIKPDSAPKPSRLSTPLTRLSWKDLMEPCSQVEDEEKSSPNDRLLWNNKHDPASFAALSPMMPRKGRKRARSSSPPMSSPSADRCKTPAVNVKKLAKALKSPHPDPTLELWDRYSLKGQSTTAANPALAQLMASASPRHSKPPAPTEGNLRRAISCGLHWPKRRRTEKMAAGGSQNSVGQRELEAASKSSLVTALLDSVTSSIHEGDPEEEAEAEAEAEVGFDSPTSKKRRSPPKQTPPRASRTIKQLSPLSDYGDDDLDDDFMELEANIRASQMEGEGEAKTMLKQSDGQSNAHLGLKQPRAQTSLDEFDDLDDDAFFKQPDGQTKTQSKAQTSLDEFDDLDHDPFKQPDGQTQAPQAQTGLDEFDDLDDDDFFDDLEPGKAPGAAAKDKDQPFKAASTQKLADFDNELEEYNFDVDFDAVELAATQSIQRSNVATTPKKDKAKVIQRYLITGVLDGDFVDQYNRTSPEKILLIRADKSTVTRTVHLRGAWFDTPAHKDSYVHIIGEFSAKGRCIVDDAHNLLILHPDQLLSSTVVADSFGCMRRAVLQDRVKATSEASPPLVYGTMLHEIFQEALLANEWDLVSLAGVIDGVIDKHIEDLYTIKVGVAGAREHLQSKMRELSCWAKSFVAAEPQADAIVEGRNGEKATMAVRKLLDVEEHVWSPMYGLKGNIDATVEVMMTDGNKSQVLTVPFEVKTGKHANSHHMAQTALYTLLLSDRYDINVACGILYYMETSRTLRIPAIRHELRHMILQRNQLACYVRERSVQLPPMLQSKHMCGRCYAKTSCFIYHRLADNGDGESSGMRDKFDEVVGHLTPRHQEFFLKWEQLLTKEEKESRKTKRELWTMTSVEREKKSRCFSDVIIEEGSASVDRQNPGINRFQYTFVKRKPSPDFTFVGSELGAGEPIVVSDEEGHYALAIGYVISISKQRVRVAVDRRLHNARIRQPGFDEVDNQVFASIMDATAASASKTGTQGDTVVKEPPVRYRLDQDEFSNGMATVRNNLVQMMANDVPAAVQLRQRIVDLLPPRFKTAASQYTVTDGESLNVDQRRAIDKVMSAQDYALVLGMPGTGKTTTIAHIIRALVSQGKTVLLTSHTHTAVDNILLKLQSDKMAILRLGAPAKVHPEVREFAHLAGQPRKTFEEIQEAWHDTPIVATTCLGINHQVFLERSFDYCIVDEASQITLPICAGPIRLARTFVLVGDHNQLPPVVKNEEARAGGLDVSLFKLLSDTHPASVVNLEHQYRMCEDIMTLSNTLIYGGRLRCGTEEVRRRKLAVPNISALRQHHFDPASLASLGSVSTTGGDGNNVRRSICPGPAASRCWLYDLVEGNARVRFVNTDTLEPRVREEAQGKRIVNTAEAQIVLQLVESLVCVGVPAGEIGVMTHYRAQLSLLRERLRGHAGVEMHTTDRFQGRDKEVVVLSLVRSNEVGNIGDLLRDWRRINVAFTRAKVKLLVVGSVGTLRESGGGGNETMLARFVGLMEEKEWVYDLPRDALGEHVFEEMQLTQTPRGKMKGVMSPGKSLGSLGERSSGGSPKQGKKGKENKRPEPRRIGRGSEVLLKGKVITRDIVSAMMEEL